MHVGSYRVLFEIGETAIWVRRPNPCSRQPGAYVLHAGTALAGGRLVSSGGRVLDIVGTGDDVTQARDAAYAAAARITMRGGWYRTDIAELPRH